MRKKLNVDGMSCNNCIETIKRFLSDINGVTFIEIDLKNKTLEIDLDDESKIKRVIDAIEDAGFVVK